MEAFFKILNSPSGSFGFIFGLLALAFWVVKKITEIKTIHGAFAKTIEKLEKNSERLITSVAVIKGQLDIVSVNKNLQFTASLSPISLTEQGSKIAKELNAVNVIANNWEKIYNTLKGELKTNNAYDIQQFCIDTASVNLDKFFKIEDIEHIKLIAYQKGITLFSFGKLFGVLIRDEYFKRENINIDEVDKDDSK